jgi:murein DD-endopeptidase MepM/ murein hydrolase activator NlpD
MASIDDAISTPPTLLASSLLRGNEGAFGSPRGGGKTHQGIDIVANQSSADKNIYQVRATAAGQIAYARQNGSQAKPGYGYTIVIDHQNDFYTLYAHLAINASAGLISVGQLVQVGDILGYLADLTNGEMSSGNARAVAPYDKIQLHFECFEAPSGRSSAAGLDQIKNGCTINDPTFRLLALGYSSF